MVLLMAVSFSFAQMKNVKEAKSIANDVKPNFKQAEQLIKEAMKNPETKDLAETWDVAGFIQKRINEEQMKNAFLRKPYDTLKVYNSILKMYEYYTKCDDLAQVPNEKGKIKNKYRKANASSMLAERPNLINGGIQYFNLDKNKEALKFFATYVESASYPMLADKEIAKNDTLLPQIAYYATLAADRVGNKDAIIKYAPMALSDKDGGKFAMQLMADAYKAKGDTVAWIKALEEGILKFPGNDYFFANLVDYYNSSNQASKAMEFADRMLSNDPNNKLYLYVKAYLYHNMKEYDNAIEFYKKAIAADPEYAEAYSNVGLVYLMKAQDYADKATTDINDPKYAEAQAVVKKFYEEAKPFYEKARALKPDQKDLWLSIKIKGGLSLAESKKEKILEYKGKPLVRCGKTIYYGSMSDPYVICLNILSDEDIKGLKVSGKVAIQLIDTDPSVTSPKEKIIKKSEKQGLFNALDLGAVWLERALKKQ